MTISLVKEIEGQLPGETVGLMRSAGGLALERGEDIYLVGGVVRDLLLKRPNLDVDLVLEGDAVGLARRLAELKQGKVVVHPSFGTAKVRWDDRSVDVATARSETYSRPGALPTVKPGSIRDDLFRRDFTINAMAVELSPGRYGQLLDLFGGCKDIYARLIRVLHEKSFIDDATRIWRSIRYEQRLGFKIEPVTLRLLKRDVDMLDTISGDRIRHELELVLKEEFPEKVLRRADELGMLANVHRSLKGDTWLAEKFQEARRAGLVGASSFSLYLALLMYRLRGEELEQVIAYLRLSKATGQVLRDTLDLRAKLGLLSVLDLKPSETYGLLKGYSPTAITATSIATGVPAARQHLRFFMDKLRYVRQSLTGADLIRMGIPPGPRIKKHLERLRQARLDGEVKSRKDEERMVGQWKDETDT